MRPDHAVPDAKDRFRLGINCWPSRTAISWWQDFDEAETGDDLARIASSGFDSVRLFMTWEAFQPTPDAVDTRMLDLEAVEFYASPGLHVPRLYGRYRETAAATFP